MNIDDLINKCTDTELVEIILSGRKQKTQDGASKIKIRLVKIKNKVVFQASEYVGKQVIHSNLKKEELRDYVNDNLVKNFKQGQFAYVDGDGQVLCGSKGNMTVKYKKNVNAREQKSLEHNKRKQYILEEGKPVGFLIDLGVMTKECKIITSKYDKFKQINRFLEFIEDILPQLSDGKEQTIIDFGCGKSYLTFAMYYYLKVLKGYNIRIIGLDLKKDVIEHCNQLRTKYGYDRLDFYEGDIASYKGVDSVDMVVTLHACDTATDYALAKAVKWGAKVILSVPCCQHEANRTIADDTLAPVMDYGILKERFAAIATDGARAKLLESKGYQTQIIEFIDMEHTPKNLLIRAVKTGKPDAGAYKEVLDMSEALNIDLTLKKLLED